MKCFILAGGFGKRLGKISKNVPKPLLKIGRNCVLDYILAKINSIKDLDEIIISTNIRFYNQFRNFLHKNYKNTNIKLYVEPSTNDKTKLGSVGAIYYFIDKENINDDLMIIAGDNIFGFDIKKFLRFFYRKNSSIIAIKDIKDKEKSKNFGVVILNKEFKILNLIEKPKEPSNTLISSGCYILKKSHLNILKDYMASGFNKDSLGSFFNWLAKNSNVFGYKFNDYWFDIGNLEILKDAQRHFKYYRK